MKKILKTLIFFAIPAFAAHVAVLETGVDDSAKEKVSRVDRQYLTNVLREEAVKQLPAVQNYTIMTRENIQQMLPPGKGIEDCEGSCLVETGKNISADYICQARIGSFGGELTLSAELYETAGNKLMASFNGRGVEAKDLLLVIEKKAPDFFRSIKGNSIGFADIGGIGDIDGAGEFSFAGKKKFVIEIASVPAGALPTIDGKGIPKCTSTPCRVQVEEGNHRIVMSKDQYEDAETVVEVNANNQKVELTLESNYGFLEVQPILAGGVADKGNLNVNVDDSHMEGEKISLAPGIHKVRVTHPCYDPVEFKVSIARNKIEVFDKPMLRGKGGLELNAEYNGEPQIVAMFVDGLEVGSTPYVGEVPLCAEVTLRGEDWIEKVDVTPKWHEVVQKTHTLKHVLPGTILAEDKTRNNAVKAYDELDDKSSSQVGESVPSNIDGENKGSAIRWVVLGVGTAVGVTGAVLAVVGNNQAKDASETKISSVDDYDRNKDKARNGQILRGVGLGLAVAGVVGVGISFAF